VNFIKNPIYSWPHIYQQNYQNVPDVANIIITWCPVCYASDHQKIALLVRSLPFIYIKIEHKFYGPSTADYKIVKYRRFKHAIMFGMSFDFNDVPKMYTD
jgi:hypothetical protein